MEAARASGLSAIGVLWGYGSRDELLRAGAETVCAAPIELVDVLGTITS
jgi:phosphoglycolate phosphatase